MRLIVMLVALLIVGLLIYKQMAPVEKPQDVQATAAPDAPKIPTNPNDVKKFGDQMNEYVQSESARRAAELEDAASK